MWTSYSPGPAVQCCVLSPYPTSTSCEDRERERERERAVRFESVLEWKGRDGDRREDRGWAGLTLTPLHPPTGGLSLLSDIK